MLFVILFFVSRPYGSQDDVAGLMNRRPWWYGQGIAKEPDHRHVLPMGGSVRVF